MSLFVWIYWMLSVLINAPTRGYGIFIENMLEAG